MRSEFLLAAADGNLLKVQSLLKEGIATGIEANEAGDNALWSAIINYRFQTAQWLVEYGGVELSCPDPEFSGGARGEHVWDLIFDRVVTPHANSPTALLREVLLRKDTPAHFEH
jgi:hypothetical protein